MLLQIAKSFTIVTFLASASFAGAFNKQAEHDRKALIKYFEEKFEKPFENKERFFPNSTDEELRNNIVAGIKWEDFSKGSYAFSKNGKVTYESLKEFPPYEDLVDRGQELYEQNSALKKCFPDVAIAGDYPYYDQKRSQVVTLTQAINECLVADGQKKLNEKKGDMAFIQAYFTQQTQDQGKKVNIKIESEEAADAYERGKQYYYAQRGYLSVSCATCHVDGTAKRVRNESMSPLLGSTTHFPVYRLKWAASKQENGFGTLERRMTGCIKDQGQNPPKASSDEVKELIYFSAYMSNGMTVDGPDLRK